MKPPALSPTRRIVISAAGASSLGGIAAVFISERPRASSPGGTAAVFTSPARGVFTLHRSGNATVKVVPSSSDEQETAPPWSSTMARTTESPTPFPFVAWEGSP